MILIAGIALVGMFALPLFADGRGCGGNWRGSGYGDCPYYGSKGNGLTQDQLAEIGVLRDEFLASTEKTREQLQDKNYSLRLELTKSAPDENRVRELQTEISKLRTEMDSARVENMLKVKKIAPDARAGYSSRDGRHMGERYSGCYGGSRGFGPGENL